MRNEKSILSPKLLGGFGDRNFGKQYRQGNRVYISTGIAPTLTASINNEKYVVQI